MTALGWYSFAIVNIGLFLGLMDNSDDLGAVILTMLINFPVVIYILLTLWR